MYAHGVFWDAMVYLLLASFALGVIFMFGTLVAYAFELVHEYLVLPVRTRKARRHEAMIRRVPRRDLRHLPH